MMTKNSRLDKIKPVDCPSPDEISNAIETLNRQQLHVYQVLYKNGLTNPWGSPLQVERHASSNHLTICIHIYPQNNKEYGFVVYPDTPDDEILNKATLLKDARYNNPISRNACCPLAVHRHCVCMESFDCPVHGGRCIGSHD